MATKLKKGDKVDISAAEPNFTLNATVMDVKKLYRTVDGKAPSAGYHEAPPEYIAVDVIIVRSENADGTACEDLYEADEVKPSA